MELRKVFKSAGHWLKGLLFKVDREIQFDITANPEIDSQGGNFLWKIIDNITNAFVIRDEVDAEDILVIDTLNKTVEVKAPYTTKGFIPNAVHETFDFVAAQNVDQAVIDNVFYGSVQTFQVGRYNQASFWLDNHTAGVGESCELRFGIYDSTFNLLREASLTVDDTTVQNEEKVLNFTELVLDNPERLYIVFGKNDEVGNFTIDSSRIDAPSSSNADIIFTFNHASGALPADISAIRAAGTRVFYNAIFKLS